MLSVILDQYFWIGVKSKENSLHFDPDKLFLIFVAPFCFRSFLKLFKLNLFNHVYYKKIINL